MRWRLALNEDDIDALRLEHIYEGAVLSTNALQLRSLPSTPNTTSRPGRRAPRRPRSRHRRGRPPTLLEALERKSRPANLCWTFFGAQFGYAVYVLRGLLIVFGLSWWSAVATILVGSAIGSLAVASVALIGPRTGTNSTVSSGAYLGVRGRYLGSLLAQFDNLGFNVLITSRR
jgi:Permease for cytosine/purines, uracil, thiamine, allantoin